MAFILRFQTYVCTDFTQASARQPTPPSAHSVVPHSVVVAGTKTITEIRKEAADADPGTRCFEVFPQGVKR
jgi:hypothetical protein